MNIKTNNPEDDNYPGSPTSSHYIDQIKEIYRDEDG
jgi:hypothetical protein